jgi:ABC-2 type transport system permease protein
MWKRIIEGAKESAEYFVDELKLIFSDAGAVLLFVIAMFIYPLLYAIGYEKEIIRDLPVAIVDMDHSSASRQYSRMADATEQLQVKYKPSSLKEAETLFYEGKVKGIILLPDNFEKDILTGKQTSVTAYCDASYFLLYKQVFTGTSFTNGTFNAGIEVKRMLAEGKSIPQAIDLQEPIKVSTYNLYNPVGGYGSFVMPGMILIIMQQTLLIGIGMLGGTIREKKIFLKMTGRAKHHIGSARLVFGKASAYTFVYLFNAVFALGILYKWFGYPDNSSFIESVVLFIPYILSVSFLGLAISMLFKERVHSMLFMVFLSPMVVFLSGISWPSAAIPPVLYSIAHIFPSTSMVPAYLQVRTCGASLSEVKFEWGLLLIQAVIYFGLACLSYHYAIRKFGSRIGSNSAVTK